MKTLIADKFSEAHIALLTELGCEVTYKPGAKAEAIEKLADCEFSVRVKAPAREGKANEALIRALSGYFNIPKSRISIVSGLGSKKKIVDIF